MSSYSTFLLYLLVATIVYYLVTSVTEKFTASETVITTSGGTSVIVTPNMTTIHTTPEMISPTKEIPSETSLTVEEGMQPMDVSGYYKSSVFEDGTSGVNDPDAIPLATPYAFSKTAEEQKDPVTDTSLPVYPDVTGADPNLMQNDSQIFTTDSPDTIPSVPSPYDTAVVAGAWNLGWNKSESMSKSEWVKSESTPKPETPTQHIDEFVPILNMDFPGNDKFCQVYSEDMNQSYCRGQCSQDGNCVGYVDVKAGTNQLFPQGFCCSKTYVKDSLQTPGVISYIKPKYA